MKKFTIDKPEKDVLELIACSSSSRKKDPSFNLELTQEN